jgi:hypothetical protein
MLQLKGGREPIIINQYNRSSSMFWISIPSRHIQTKKDQIPNILENIFKEDFEKMEIMPRDTTTATILELSCKRPFQWPQVVSNRSARRRWQL